MGLGEVKWVLGMLLERDRAARTISILQEAFINSILARFSLTDATALSTPLALGTHLSAADCPTTQEEMDEMATRPYREPVGALAWLILGTRPDTLRSPPACSPASAITQDASIGKQQSAYCAIIRVRRGGASLSEERRRRLLASQMRTGGAIATIGDRLAKIGCGAVSWKSKKQSFAALSSTEAEYMALRQAAKESVWMVDFLKNLGISVSDSMVKGVLN